jgi:hypothetical protein
MGFNREKSLPKDVGISAAKAFLNCGSPFEFSLENGIVTIKYNSSDQLLIQHTMLKAGYRDPDDPGNW